LTLLNFQVVEKCSQDILRAAGREGERKEERERERCITLYRVILRLRRSSRGYVF
jgi:hypothetical protein